MKYSVVVNMDLENKTTLRNMDFTKTTHLFIKNKKNGIKKCDLTIHLLLIYHTVGGGGGGIISIKFKKYLKLQFLNHPSGISCI